MRSLPQEEPQEKSKPLRSKNHFKKKQPKFEVAGLLRKIEKYAEDGNPSAARTSQLIQETRYEILQIHLSHKKNPNKNRHTASRTKKRPDKYRSH